MKNFFEWSKKNDPKFGQKRIWAFDLDDTLTTDGELPCAVISKLYELQSLGHKVVMVTGRPASWALPFVKTLCFDAVIAENGAFLCFWKNGKVMRKLAEEPVLRFWTTSGYLPYADFLLEGQGEDLKKKQLDVQRAVFEKFPQMTLASDQPFRTFDLAIDFAESVNPPRPLVEARQVKAIFESYGAVAKVSSIHVNGWWGAFDKSQGLTGLLSLVSWSLYFDDVIYFGDSPNDAPLFDVAQVSVGVANLKAFDADNSWKRPKFLTSKKSSEGVLEAIMHYTSQESKV